MAAPSFECNCNLYNHTYTHKHTVFPKDNKYHEQSLYVVKIHIFYNHVCASVDYRKKKQKLHLKI